MVLSCVRRTGSLRRRSKDLNFGMHLSDLSDHLFRLICHCCVISLLCRSVRSRSSSLEVLIFSQKSLRLPKLIYEFQTTEDALRYRNDERRNCLYWNHGRDQESNNLVHIDPGSHPNKTFE